MRLNLKSSSNETIRILPIREDSHHETPMHKIEENMRFLLKYLHICNFFCTFALAKVKSVIMPSVEVQKMIPKIRKYLATQPVERAYLFGSCSRGEETPESDVDLLVTYTDSDSLSLMDIGGMITDLSKIVHRPVDLIEDEYLMPFARQSADKDKIKIYERAY